MILAVLAGAGLYGLVGMLFLILSVAELLESGRSTPARLLLTIVTSALWPVTLLVTSLIVVIAHRRRAHLPVDDPAALNFFQR